MVFFNIYDTSWLEPRSLVVDCCLSFIILFSLVFAICYIIERLKK